jgi:plastocyanin
MRKLLWISALLLGFTIGCSDDDDNDVQPDNEVWMSASAFLPSNLTVPAGTTVRWVNNSSVTHNVVSATGLFNELLNVGESYSYTFSDAGTYNYECTIHPGMTGTITVQ